MVGWTWVAVVIFFICAIRSSNPEWAAFGVVLLLVYGHHSLRNDESTVLLEKLKELEAGLATALAEIAKFNGGK